MKEITISEKNFKRFAKRYQKLHNIGLMDAQEQLSQVLGCSNYHELNKNLQQNSYSYQQYNNFLFEVKSHIDINTKTNNLYYFDFREDKIKYVSHELHFMEVHFYSENQKTSLCLDKSDFNQSRVEKEIKDILSKYLLNKDSEQWLKGFVGFLQSLPQSINAPGVFILYTPPTCKYDNKIFIPLIKHEEFKKDSEDHNGFETHYDLDYFSQTISNVCQKKYHSSINEGTGYEDLDQMEENLRWFKMMISDEDMRYASTLDEELIWIDEYDGEMDIDDVNNSEVF